MVPPTRHNVTNICLATPGMVNAPACMKKIWKLDSIYANTTLVSALLITSYLKNLFLWHLSFLPWTSDPFFLASVNCSSFSLSPEGEFSLVPPLAFCSFLSKFPHAITSAMTSKQMTLKSVLRSRALFQPSAGSLSPKSVVSDFIVHQNHLECLFGNGVPIVSDSYSFRFSRPGVEPNNIFLQHYTRHNWHNKLYIFKVNNLVSFDMNTLRKQHHNQDNEHPNPPKSPCFFYNRSSPPLNAFLIPR